MISQNERITRIVFYSRIKRSAGEIWLLDQDSDLISGMKKRSKISCIYTNYQCVQESQYTKLILAPWFTVVVEKVTQYGLLAQISQKSVAGCTIDGMQLHFLMNSFTFPVVS